ncbi:SpaA isopeptide-forming pilin-related protein [Mycoplasma sp. P36-A1]|uniref:SpaA isopeptide-forming pilin-related protein n=1 Tax=Mycoplasma sp. P36-A1 TaxID=3252900 RepID=UPI003C2DFC9B
MREQFLKIAMSAMLFFSFGTLMNNDMDVERHSYLSVSNSESKKEEFKNEVRDGNKTSQESVEKEQSEQLTDKKEKEEKTNLKDLVDQTKVVEEARKALFTNVELKDTTKTLKIEDSLDFIFDFKLDHKMYVDDSGIENFEYDMLIPNSLKLDTSNLKDQLLTTKELVFANIKYDEKTSILTLVIDKENIDSLNKGKVELSFTFNTSKVKEGDKINYSFFDSTDIKDIEVDIALAEIIEEDKESTEKESEKDNSSEENKTDENKEENNKENKEETTSKKEDSNKVDALSSGSIPNNRNNLVCLFSKEADCGGISTEFDNVDSFFNSINVTFANGSDTGSIVDIINVEVDFTIPKFVINEKWTDGSHVFKDGMFIQTLLPNELSVPDEKFEGIIKFSDSDEIAGTFVITKDDDKNTCNENNVCEKYLTIYFNENAEKYARENSMNDLEGSVYFTINLNKSEVTKPGELVFSIPGNKEVTGSTIYILSSAKSMVTKTENSYFSEYYDKDKHLNNKDKIDWEIIVNAPNMEISSKFNVKDSINTNNFTIDSYEVYQVEIGLDGKVLEDSEKLLLQGTLTEDNKVVKGEFAFDKTTNTFFFDVDSSDNKMTTNAYMIKIASTPIRTDYDEDNNGKQYFENEVFFNYEIMNNEVLKPESDDAKASLSIWFNKDVDKTATPSTPSYTAEANSREINYTLDLNRSEEKLKEFDYKDTLTFLNYTGNYKIEVLSMDFGYYGQYGGFEVKNSIDKDELSKFYTIEDITKPENTYGKTISIKIEEEDLKELCKLAKNIDEYYCVNTLKVNYKVVFEDDYLDDILISNTISGKDAVNVKKESSSGLIEKTIFEDGYGGVNTSKGINYNDKRIQWRININGYRHDMGDSPSIVDSLPTGTEYIDKSMHIQAHNIEVSYGSKNKDKITGILCDSNIAGDGPYDKQVKNCVNNSLYLSESADTNYQNIIIAPYTLSYNKTSNQITVKFNFADNKEESSATNGIKIYQYNPSSKAISEYKGYSDVSVNNKSLSKAAINMFFQTTYDPVHITKQCLIDNANQNSCRTLTNKATLNIGEKKYKADNNVRLNNETKNNGSKSGEYTESTKNFNWNVYFDYNDIGVNNGLNNEKAVLVDELTGYHEIYTDDLTFKNFTLTNSGDINNYGEGITLKDIATNIGVDISTLFEIEYLDSKYKIVASLDNPAIIEHTRLTLNLDVILKSDWYQDGKTKFTFDRMAIEFSTEIADGVYRSKDYSNKATLTTYINGTDTSKEYSTTVNGSTSVPNGGQFINKTGVQSQNGEVTWNVVANKSLSRIGNIKITDTISSNQVLKNDSVKVYYANDKFEATDELKIEHFNINNKEHFDVVLNEDGTTTLNFNFSNDLKLEGDALVIVFKTNYVYLGFVDQSEKLTNNATIDYNTEGYEKGETKEDVVVKYRSGNGVIYATSHDSVKLKIFKTTEDKKTPLEGVKFVVELVDENTKPTGFEFEGETDSNGEINFDQRFVRGQNVIIKEIAAPDGYVIDKELYDGKTIQLDSENNNMIYLFSVSNDKVNELELDKRIHNLYVNENTSDEIKRAKELEIIENLKFDLFILDSNNNTCEFEQKPNNGNPYTVNSNGKINLGRLAVANYKLVERENSSTVIDENPYYFAVEKDIYGQLHIVSYTGDYDYSTDNNCDFTIDLNREDKVKDILNYLGKVTLTKKDTDGNLLKGAIFELFKENDQNSANSIGVYEFKDNSSITVNNLKPGNYYFKEIKAPELHQISDEKIEFIISNTMTTGSSSTYIINRDVINKKMDPVHIDKKVVGIENFDNNTKFEILEGAKFNLTKLISDNCDNDVLNIVSSNSLGQIELGVLSVGKYCITEIESTNSVIDTKPLRFEIIYDQGTKNNKVKLNNEYNAPVFLNYLGRVELTKIDEKSNEQLMDGTFELYKQKNDVAGLDDELKGTYTLSKDITTIIVNNLVPGKYYFKETVAPDGYKLPKQNFPFEIIKELDSGTKEFGNKIDIKLNVENTQFEEVGINKYGINNKNSSKQPLGAGYEFNLYKLNSNQNTCDVLNSNQLVTKDNVAKVFISDASGYINLGNIDVSKYCLKEIKVPHDSKYAINPEALLLEVQIKENQDNIQEKYIVNVDTVYFENYLGKVELTKTSENGKLNKKYAKNARFNLYKQVSDSIDLTNDTLIEKDLSLNSSNKIIVNNLAVGKYYFIETKAPLLHILDSTPLAFEIVESPEKLKQLNVTTTLDNKLMLDLEITKKGYVDGTNDVTIKGANFDLYKATNNTCDTLGNKENTEILVSDDNGKVNLGLLEVGSYCLQETGFSENSNNDGYLLNTAPLLFEVIYNNEQGSSHVIKNDENTNEQPIFYNYKKQAKLFKIDNELVNLVGAQFQVYKYTGEKGNINEDELVDTIDCDGTGIFHSKMLSTGKYYFYESKSPANYLKSDELYYFEIKEEMSATSVEDIFEAEFRAINLRVGGLVIRKVDENGQPLANAQFKVSKENNEVVISNVMSDENGWIALGNLETGDYIIEELKTSSSDYMLNTEKLSFKVVFDVESNMDVIEDFDNTKFVNYQGKQRLVKVDGNNKELKGATFGLYDNNNVLIKNIDMKELSIVIIDQLAPGNYKLKELESPDGYQLNEKEFMFYIPSKNEGDMDNDYLNKNQIIVENIVSEDKETEESDVVDYDSTEDSTTEDSSTDNDDNQSNLPSSGSMLLAIAIVFMGSTIIIYYIDKKVS